MWMAHLTAIRVDPKPHHRNENRSDDISSSMPQEKVNAKEPPVDETHLKCRKDLI